MRTHRFSSILSLSVGILSIMMVLTAANAQEYDDMYFSKSDRKTVKVEKAKLNTNSNSANYKEVTQSTEAYSAKNINPEYIARYKATESNEVSEQPAKKDDAYSRKDYFVEDYDNAEYIENQNKGEIDYAALNKRDQMSARNNNNYSNFNNPFSSPSWRFTPYMAMSYGYPYYGGGFGYDPFMSPYRSSMAMRYGSGFGYGPSMSFSVGMSWGSGYSPWNSGFYSPYGMGGYYDPFGSMYGYRPYSGFGYSPFYGGGYGGFCPSYIATSYYMNASSDINGRNIRYQPRTTRTSASQNVVRRIDNSENTRTSPSTSRIRVPNRANTTSVSNGRISKDYSKVQNEYYNTSRRSSSSSRRISTSDYSSKGFSSRNSATSSRYSSSISKNKPSRSSAYSTGSRSGSFSNKYSSGSNSRSSYSPSRSSSSSFGRSSSTSSGSRSTSSFSSGSSRSSSSSGSRSSSGGSSSSRSGRQ